MSDYLNNTVRKIDANGNVTTVAGVAGRSGTADGDPLPRIHVLSFTVFFSDPAKISGCTNASFPNCQVTFERAGVTTGATVNTARSVDAIAISITAPEGGVFPSTGDSATPDIIGNLKFVLASTAAGGDINLTFTKSGATATSEPLALDSTGQFSELAPDLQAQSGSISVPASTCLVAPPTSGVDFTYTGGFTGCSPSNSVDCRAGELITFTTTAIGYTFQSCDSITWDFGDNKFAAGKTVQHSYAANGHFQVALTISNPSGGVRLVTFVNVAAAAQSICVPALSKPTGGETWTIGGSQDIKWTSSGPCGLTFTIELLKSGALYDVITTSAIVGNKLFTFTPPETYATGSDYKIRILDTQSGSTATSAGTFSIVAAKVPQDTSLVKVLGGTLAGQAISSTDPAITVAPGASISGSFSVSIDSTFASSQAVSLGVTPSWGAHATSYLDLGHFSTPVSGLTMTVSINFTAPATTGTYYIVTAFNREDNAAQVLSCTDATLGNGTPVWDDGNDVARWSAAQMTAALTDGRAPGSVLYAGGYAPLNIPAAVIVVNVEDPCKLVVVRPTGTDTWFRGTPSPIIWTSSGACGSTLELALLLHGTAFRDLGSAPTAGGQITYTPVDGDIDSAGYQILIVDGSTEVSAASFEFTIKSPGTCVLGCSASVPASVGQNVPALFAAFTNPTNCSAPASGYIWSFGDGTPAIRLKSPNMVHAYAAPGTYTWSVYISGGDINSGCALSGTIEVIGTRRRTGK